MNKPLKNRSGAVQAIAVAVVALAGITYVAIATIPGARTSSTTVAKKAIDGHALPAAFYLDVLGLSPDALAAAGVSAEQAGVVFSNLQSYLDGDGSQLQAVIDTWGEANTAADMAVRAVQSGKGDVDTMTSLNTAFTTAASNKQSTVNAAFSAAVLQLDGSVADVLARIHLNRPQNVPVQYLVVDRTASQWRQLRDALSRKHTQEAAGRSLDTDVATFLADIDADSAVSAAAGRVVANLAAIKAAMQ